VKRRDRSGRGTVATVGLGLVALDQLHGLMNQAGEGDTDTGPGAGGDNAQGDTRAVALAPALGSCWKEWTSLDKISADVARLLLPHFGAEAMRVGGAMLTVSRVVASLVILSAVSVLSVFSVLSSAGRFSEDFMRNSKASRRSCKASCELLF